MSSENVQEKAHSSEISGKKIFFLYPTASIQNQVISELAQHELEVYVSKRHDRLLHVLKKYPDSIVFANIDEGISEIEWGKWIDTVKITQPDVSIGVLSAAVDEEKRGKYLKNPKIVCGFIPLRKDMTKEIGQILAALEKVNAKGMRKYLRATTEREANANLNLPFNGDILNAVVKDISVVGVSCVFAKDPEFSKNTLVKDVQIRLQTMLLKVEAIVFGCYENSERKIYVLIFTQRTDPDVRVKIRKYIQHNLQQKMDPELG